MKKSGVGGFKSGARSVLGAPPTAKGMHKGLTPRVHKKVVSASLKKKK